MNESTIFQVIRKRLQALGYPLNSIRIEVEAGRERRLDMVVFYGGRAAIIIEVKSGELFPGVDDKLLPFNASVRRAQFAAVEIGAPLYVLTDGSDFLWFETDSSGRPARLQNEKRFDELAALIGERDEREQRASSVHLAVRQLLEKSYAENWSPETLPLLLYAYLQKERGDTTLFEYLARHEHESPPASLVDVHDFVLKRDRGAPTLYNQALDILSASRLSELSPRDTLQIVDNLTLRSRNRAGSLRLPRWTADLMVRLACIRPGDRVLDLNGETGNLSAAVRLNSTTDAKFLTICVQHSADALWTVIQQLLFENALPLVRVGDPLQIWSYTDARRTPADCILIAPPFGAVVRDSSHSQARGRTLSSEEAYIREALTLLSPTGRIVALLPNGALSSPTKKSFREDVLSRNGLTAVLDVGTFLPGSGVAASIVVLDRSVASSNRLFFANAQYRLQEDHFDCREVPALAHVMARFEAWERDGRDGFLPVDDTGLSAVADAEDGTLNAAPYLAQQAQLTMPFASFEHLYLESVAEVTKGGPVRRNSEGTVPFIGPGAIRPLEVDLDPADRTSEAEIGMYPKAIVVEGDVVLNGLSTYLAAAALIETGRYLINRHVFRIRADRGRVLPAYLVIAINSRYVRDALRQSASGSTIKMLTLPILRRAIIPIPPLPIQQEIVQRVGAAKAERDAAAEDFRTRELALNSMIDGLGAGDAV